MRVVRPVSVLFTALGVAALVLGPIALGPTWTLLGLLLVVAGVVKLVVAHLWRHLTADAGIDERA